MNALLVFGFYKLPSEVILPPLSDTFRLAFQAEDSLYLGPYHSAQSPVGELWRLHQNFNVLENAWLEDAARDCGVLLYVGHIADGARIRRIRHAVLSLFPSAREIRYVGAHAEPAA